MKKIIVLLIAFAGLFSPNLNAQSCCTPKVECKPAQCCPTKPDCCESTKSIGNATVTATKVESSKQKETNPINKPKHPVKKEEKLLVANKKQ